MALDAGFWWMVIGHSLPCWEFIPAWITNRPDTSPIDVRSCRGLIAQQKCGSLRPNVPRSTFQLNSVQHAPHYAIRPSTPGPCPNLAEAARSPLSSLQRNLQDLPSSQDHLNAILLYQCRDQISIAMWQLEIRIATMQWNISKRSHDPAMEPLWQNVTASTRPGSWFRSHARCSNAQPRDVSTPLCQPTWTATATPNSRLGVDARSRTMQPWQNVDWIEHLVWVSFFLPSLASISTS